MKKGTLSRVMKDQRSLSELGAPSTTPRGFGLIEFKDDYGEACELQQSSNGARNCIWLGLAKVEPKVLAREARQVGVTPDQMDGWVNYPIPEQVFISTRMHLNEKQVRALMKTLQGWLDTGELK